MSPATPSGVVEAASAGGILAGMHISPVDPRDVEGGARDPAYQVYVWEPTAPPAASDPDRYMMACTEYRLTDVRDVHEVIEWAERSLTAEQAYELFVETRTPGLRLVRLAGLCPADPEDLPSWRPRGA